MSTVVHKTHLATIEPGYKTQGEVFRVKEAKLKQTKAGKDFYVLNLMNKHGSGEVNIWDPHSVISEGEFLEMYMSGTEHQRFGKQWKVTLYSKSDYKGDEGFVDEEDVPDIQALVDRVQGYRFTDSTCKSLYEQFLADYFVDEPDFSTCPASVTYYKRNHGLIQYTKNILSLVDSVEACPFINMDLMRICAIVHHLGSLSCFSLSNNGNFFIANEIGFLSTPEDELGNRLEELRMRAQHKRKPVDATVFTVIQAVCKSIFTEVPVSEESLMLVNFARVSRGLETLQAIARKHSGELIIREGNKVYVNTTKLFEDKNGAQES